MTNSTLALSPLGNNLDAVMQDLPKPLNRRHLLSRSAAIGAASQVGLLGSALLGSSQAHAASITYANTGIAGRKTGTYIVGSKVYKYEVREYKHQSGDSVWYIVTSLENEVDKGRGIKYFPKGNSWQWIKNCKFSFETVHYDLIVSSTSNANDWILNGNRRRLEEDLNKEWGLPIGSIIVDNHQEFMTGSELPFFVGVTYTLASGTRKFTNFYLNYIRPNGTGYSSKISTVSGTERSAVMQALNEYILKRKSGTVIYGTGSAALIGAGVALAGGYIYSSYAEEGDAPYFTMVGTILTMIIGGIAITREILLHRLAVTSAGRSAVIAAEAYVDITLKG